MALLGACSGEQHGDLQDYIQSVKASQKGRIAPLPEVLPYETFTYSAADLRDPFEPAIDAEALAAIDTGIRPPDQNRRREALEDFPLDTLKLVGHLANDKGHWALVAAPDNTVHRVQVGNHLGQNYGQIKVIDEARLELTEIIPNGLGGWIERQALLTLSE